MRVRAVLDVRSDWQWPVAWSSLHIKGGNCVVPCLPFRLCKARRKSCMQLNGGDWHLLNSELIEELLIAKLCRSCQSCLVCISRHAQTAFARRRADCLWLRACPALKVLHMCACSCMQVRLLPNYAESIH